MFETDSFPNFLKLLPKLHNLTQICEACSKSGSQGGGIKGAEKIFFKVFLMRETFCQMELTPNHNLLTSFDKNLSILDLFATSMR